MTNENTGHYNETGGNLIPNSVLFNRKTTSKKSVSCPLSGEGAPVIDYKNIELLSRFISEKGRILPSRLTGVSASKQRDLTRAIKQARNIALLPFSKQ